MIDNWRSALSSSVFRAYLFANIFGLVIALVFSSWTGANIYVATLAAYSFSVSAPLVFDLMNNTPPLTRNERAEVFGWGLTAALLTVALFIWQNRCSILLAIIVTLITILIWGGTYSKDEKMDVKFPRRGVFDNHSEAMKNLASRPEKRDVDI